MISILWRSNSPQKSAGYKRSAKQRKKNYERGFRKSRKGAHRGERLFSFRFRVWDKCGNTLALLAPLRQIRIQKAKHVRVLDRTHTFLLLQLLDVSVKFFHFSPVNLRTEMVFGVITVVEEQPVINFAVAANSPGNRLVGVGTVMTVVAIQITKTMAEIPERQEIQHELPINEVNRIRRNDDRHHQKRRCERSQFDVAP